MSNQPLTGKQLLFAQEVAKGSTLSDAYRTAYDSEKMSSKTINEKASLLMANDKIRTRVEELRQQSLEHVKYDIEEHYKELEQVRKLALIPTGEWGNIQLNPAIKAIELKGKLKGMYAKETDVEVQSGGITVKIMIGEK
jgi:hypothetical protein